MPSTSKKQHNFMAAVANNPAFAKKAGVPQSVGEDFTNADKAASVKGGPRARPDLQKVNTPKTLHGKNQLFKQGGQTMATKMGKPMMKPGMSTAKDGMKKPTPMAKPEMAGSMMGMKKGGMAKMGSVKTAAPNVNGIASKGKTKGKQIVMSGKKI
jgi:hypothetical protein